MTTTELAYAEIEKPVSNFKRIFSLQKERQSVRPEEDLDRARSIDKQIAQVDTEIDRKVYALYGLMEDEVKVVGGNQKIVPSRVRLHLTRSFHSNLLRKF